MRSQVLLVEDSASDEKLALRAFERCAVEHSVVVVRDGQEALDYLFGAGLHASRDTSSLPGVILLDLKLPRVDGLEVLRRIRADDRTRLVPVVVLTASREDEDLERCYALGANAYVRKPLDFTAFVEAARTIAQFWLALNEPAPTPRGAP